MDGVLPLTFFRLSVTNLSSKRTSDIAGGTQSARITEKGTEEIVANPPIAAGGPDARLLDGSRGGASDICVD